MKLYRPLQNNLMSQGFGPEKTNPSMLSQYQAIGLRAHNGLDFPAPMGADIRFNGTGKGKVVETSSDPKAGLGVVVFFQDGNKYYKTIYWHLLELWCKTGDIVESNSLLGKADSTGWSTGSHLHFGLKECDSDGVIINRNNGYDGAIDPEPFLQQIYIKDYVDLLNKQLGLIQQVIIAMKKLLGIK